MERYWPNQFDTTTSGTLTQSFDFTTDTDTLNTTWDLPDPLVDWLPNSCLHEKYVPTWHLVKSYKNG